MKLKKLLALILALAALCALCVPALAAEEDAADAAAAPVAVFVGLDQRELDLSALPSAPYYEGGALMVPLRAVAEALGYAVGWDAATGTITVDDEYIQYAALHGGSAAAEFGCYLQVIDLSRTVENAAATVILAGRSYVPAAFFAEFFNDVTLTEKGLFIAPQTAELDAAS